MEFEKICTLLTKSLAGTLSEEESRELSAWIAENPANENTWKTLSDPSCLEDSYRSWRMVSTGQPQENMRLRIRALEKPRRRALVAAAAAVLAVLLVTSLVALNRSERRYRDLQASYETLRYMDAIHPGQTRAQLTTEDGKVNVLGSDPQGNDAALKAAETAENARRRQERADRQALNKLEIPRGGEFHITLEDGTDVWLNAESSLRYPEHFGAERREVELSGEAYFKVAKESDRPFRVRIAGQVIQVHGTEFNVMSYDEDKFVYTTLVEGSISLHPENAASSELILTPGHQAVFAKADCSTSVQRVKTEVVTSWRNGMFVFENQTLDQIMRQLSRWYDFSYAFSGDEAAATVFMGRVPRYGTFGDVLEILEKSGNLQFRAEGKRIIISKNNQ